MKKLRVAIIGQGRSGRDIHGKYLLTDTQRFQVMAVVDQLEDRRNRARQEYGCPVYENYTDLYTHKDIDFIINATFSYQHAKCTIDLLSQGYNVLVEKPAATSSKDFKDMMQAAEKSGAMLAVFQQRRFSPYFEKIQQVIASGVLGRLVQIDLALNEFGRRWDWQCCQDYGGGSLFNTGPHAVDQALQLLNYPDGMPSVLCRLDRANTFGDAEDFVKLILTAPGRPIIDVEVSCCDTFPKPVCKIQGTRGGLTGTMTHLEWMYYSEKEAPPRQIIRKSLSDTNGCPAYCNEELVWMKESWESQDSRIFTYATRRLYDSVYDHLTLGAPLLVTPEQILQQMLVMEECHKQNPLSKFQFEEEGEHGYQSVRM